MKKSALKTKRGTERSELGLAFGAEHHTFH